MPDSTNKTISIRIAIDIPVETADSTIEKLQVFAASLSQNTKQIAHQQPLLIENDEITQAIKHVGQKAHADLKAEEVRKQLDADNSEMRQKQLTEARAWYDLNVVQAYRLFRRIRSDFDREYSALKTVSIHFDWPVSAAQHAVATRKRIVKSYLKLRRKRNIMLLIFKGWSNKRIAAHYDIHPKTVSKIFSELRKGFRI